MRAWAILLIVVSVLLVGCNVGQSSGDSISAPKTPFLEGVRGVEVEFLEGAPPEEVTDGGIYDFQAVIQLNNQGEFDVRRDDVRVNLIGILPADFGVAPSDLRDKRPLDDLGARVRDAEGNIQGPTPSEITFPHENSFFNFERSLAGNTVFIFKAEACYKYQTKAVSQICVLRDLINLDTDDICDPSEGKKVFSSSSPVSVDGFRQTVAGRDKISFSFDVSHKGTGELFKEGDATSPPADCPNDPREKREAENRVLVTVDTGLPSLRCVGLNGGTTGFIHIVDGRRTVTCTQELDPGRGDFETNVDITLDFNYQDSDQRDVLVKHLVNE